MMFVRAMWLVIACAAVAVAGGPVRLALRLEKAGVDGAALPVQVMYDGERVTAACAPGAVGSDLALKYDGKALKGTFSAAGAQYELDAQVEAGAARGKYGVTREGKKAGGVLTGTEEVAWVGYRGPEGTGIVAGNPPEACDDGSGQNIVWKVEMPNWGHSAPVVIGDRVFVISEGGWPAEQDLPVLQCLNAGTGREEWRRTLDHMAATSLSEAEKEAARAGWQRMMARYRTAYTIFNEYAYAPDAAGKEAAKAKFAAEGMQYGGWRGGGYGQLRSLRGAVDTKDARAAGRAGLTLETWQHGCGLGQSCFGQAFATPVTDGEYLYIATAFGSFFCFDRSGEMKWVRYVPGRAGEYCRNGRSPLIYRDLLISDITGVVRAFDRKTGEMKWSAAVGDDSFMSPVVVTCSDTDVLLCSNKKAFRLPDGKPLTLEGGTDFGTMALVKYDERDVAFFTGGGQHGGWDVSPTPPPAAVRFRLEGEKLIGEVMWSGIDGRAVATYTEMIYRGGRLYYSRTGCAYDALTGKKLAGPSDPKQAASGVVAASGHLLQIAGDRMYGLRSAGGGEGTPGQSGLLACWKVDGGRLADSVLRNAPVVGAKRTQVVEQNGWNTWMFSYACPFSIVGDRIYVRNYDYLWCIGRAIEGTPADAQHVLEAVRAATSAEALLPALAHPGPKVRLEAATRLALFPSEGAREPLMKVLRDEPQPETRAAAVRALDALDAVGKPGSSALREMVQKAVLDAREWWKPEKKAPWERLQQVLWALGSDAEGAVLPFFAGKDEWTAWVGTTAIGEGRMPTTGTLRDALIAAATGPSGRGKTDAAALLARMWKGDAAVDAAFRRLVADRSSGEGAAVAVGWLAGGMGEVERAAFLIETLRTTPNAAAFGSAAALALNATPQPAGLTEALTARARGKDTPQAIPAAATGFLKRLPTEQAVGALRAVLADAEPWTMLPAADALLTLQAGGEMEAVAALDKMAATPWAKGACGVLAERAAALKSPEVRKAVADVATKALSVKNADVQTGACRALGALGADGAMAKDALKALAEGEDARVKAAAQEALGKVGG